MWEFCLTIDKNIPDLKNYVYKQFSYYVKNFEGVFTINESEYDCDFVIACNVLEKNRLILFLQDLISEIICYFYKKEFLKKYLKININNKYEKIAFIYSLLFFDKETDKYIVIKNLILNKKINIFGYYNFKLNSLQNKWLELVSITNQNEIYLYNNETFIELIKFLIDNLEIKSDVLNIMKNKDSYDVFDNNFDLLNNFVENKENEENIIIKLISMCPKSINIYCSEIIPNNLKNIICKLFEKRVNFVTN